MKAGRLRRNKGQVYQFVSSVEVCNKVSFNFQFPLYLKVLYYVLHAEKETLVA